MIPSYHRTIRHWCVKVCVSVRLAKILYTERYATMFRLFLEPCPSQKYLFNLLYAWANKIHHAYTYRTRRISLFAL